MNESSFNGMAAFPRTAGFPAQAVKACLGFLGMAIWGAVLAIAGAADTPWITTWGCAPQVTDAGNMPPVPLADSVLRQFVHTSVGGKTLRLRLSNAFGKEPVVVKAAHVARAAAMGSAGNGDIDPATDRALAFQGSHEVVIPPGAAVVSDPLAFDLPVSADVGISLQFGQVSETALSGHSGSRTTSFIAPADAISAATLPTATKTQHWYILSGIEVEGGKDRGSIVILGDSITDGRGSTTDGNDRWTDTFAKRLSSHPPTAGLGVVNMGIGGNGIFGGLGPAAEKRFERDVTGQSGARYFILFEGVNDIGGARGPAVADLAGRLIKAYTEFAKQARARGMKAYAATITPFGGHSYFSPEREACRQDVNKWLRENKVFDGVIDFDAVVRDPANPDKLLPAYSSDGLHPNPAGYQAMAAAVDLKQFSP
ncbi:SGNH hydrolase [Luteolibacter sp. LG18]|nr:SGNH hydrolase [Luteolibacter sp. LG18]